MVNLVVRWPLHDRPMLVCMSALVASAALMLAASLWRASAAAHLARISSRGEVPAQSGPTLPAKDAAPDADFTVHLPETAAIDALVRDIQRHGVAAGVLFVGLDAAEKPPTAEMLGRIDVTVLLRGRYAGIKSVLSQVLGRFPNVVLQRLAVRRVTGGEDLEASIGLVVLSRSAAAARR